MIRRLIVATTAAATLISSVAPTQEAIRGTASIPDLSGTWVYPICCGVIPPLSGPGPVINKSRRLQFVDAEGLPIPNAPRDNISWIGDYTNPILKPATAEVVSLCA
jgi:hypothetical protein